MPIIDIELVEDEAPQAVSAEIVQALADELGELLGSNQASTWVRMRYLPRDQYAENQGAIDQSTRPVFVTVLKAFSGDEQQLAEARAIADKVSGLLQRPIQNTHILFQPDAVGRIAFGGELIRAGQ